MSSNATIFSFIESPYTAECKLSGRISACFYPHINYITHCPDIFPPDNFPPSSAEQIITS